MKQYKYAWVIWGLALAAVLVLMFLIPFVRTAAWWIAAGCTVLMFGLCAFAFLKAFQSDVSLESKLLGWPIFQVGYTALFVQLVVGFIFMGIASFCPVWVAVIGEMLVFTVTGICLTVKDAARQEITGSEQTVKDQTAAWKAIRARAAAIAAETNDPEMKKVAEAIRYADPTPTKLDVEITNELNELTKSKIKMNLDNIKKLLIKRRLL